MLLKKISRASQYFASIFLIILITGFCFGLRDYIPYRVVALILLLAVSIIAMLFEFAPVIMSAVISALLWDYFFIPPRFTLSIGTPEDTLTLIMYFAIALVNIVLTYKIRSIENHMLVEEGRANTIKLYNTILNSLSHELRTPISTIIAATDNLQMNRKNLNLNTQGELLDEISKASLRLNYQVENLLNMSRIESGITKLNRSWCDINDLIRSTVNKLETELKNHTVKIIVPEKFPLCQVDFALLERSLFNLLLNASLYTPSGTAITISVGESESIIDEHEIQKLGEHLIITITDEGHGFPPHEVDRVFEKFYRLNSKSGGTGLGLSIAKGFVEAHNGSIKLQNLQHGGAKFIIDIPSEMSFIANLKNE
jgi:two-component system sensor histidine kinase KdpD